MQRGLIITHVGAGGSLLSQILNDDLFVNSGRSGLIYNNINVFWEFRERFKTVKDTDWFIDRLLFNHEFSCPINNDINFIYLIREPLVPLMNLMKFGYSSTGARDYYLFRLRRICEMARKSAGSIFLTYEDVISKRAFPLIKDKLKLKENLNPDFINPDFLEEDIEVPLEIFHKCSLSYNRYLKFIENYCPVIRCSLLV